jgi:hypothetical protein
MPYTHADTTTPRIHWQQAELVFGLKTLQFKPPLEELRAQYYKEMKKFVGESLLLLL